MSEPAVHDRIAKLVADHPVLLFMKGTPLFPQCGFSSRAIAMLDRLGVEYDSVDVLQDMEIRQGIRSEEHTSELQSLMRSSYAVFCLNKKIKHNTLQTYLKYPKHLPTQDLSSRMK